MPPSPSAPHAMRRAAPVSLPRREQPRAQPRFHAPPTFSMRAERRAEASRHARVCAASAVLMPEHAPVYAAPLPHAPYVAAEFAIRERFTSPPMSLIRARAPFDFNALVVSFSLFFAAIARLRV